MPKSALRRCRVGAITQPMPSAAPISAAWPGLERAGADDFLQRDDVGVDRRQHRGDALGARPAVESPAAVDVVGDDPQRPRVRGFRLAPSPLPVSVYPVASWPG